MDTPNRQYVGVNGYGEIEVLAPLTRMTAQEALEHAAWLVAFADPQRLRFDEVLDDVLVR